MSAERGICQRQGIFHTFTGRRTDVDRKLAQIRQGLEAELGRDFDFYDADIGAMLDNKNLWDEFVKRAQAYVDTGRLEVEENDYKVEDRAQTGRGAGSVAWRTATTGPMDCKAGEFVGQPHISVSQARFRDWLDKFPEDDASRALKAIWVPWTTRPVSERIEAFTALLPTPKYERPG